MSEPWPYPAPHEDGAAAHLSQGLRLPDIALPSTWGGEINLSRMRGPSVLFVYPWTGRAGVANPPGWDGIVGAHGSTPEAEGFRDRYSEFQELAVQVFGMSGQDSAYQREFADRVRLPFPLLSDFEGELARALELPRFETGGVSYLKRLTLIVRDGKIDGIFYPVPKPPSHAADVLRALHAVA